MEACELLAIELRLDRIEAELTSELPPHLAAFARAHARGLPAPPAPDVLRRQATLATARAALTHPVLADRGLALLRLAAPIALEADPAVCAARAVEPTWEALAALAAARDAAAMARFGARAIEVMHRLHGCAADLAGLGAVTAGASATARDARPAMPQDRHARRDAAVAGLPVAAERPDATPAVASDPSAMVEAAGARGRDAPRGGEEAGLPPTVPGWLEPDGVAADDRTTARAWEELRARHGVDGTVRFERAAGARPRTFVIAPCREVIVAVPERIVTPAARFAVLHELGHAVAALALPAGLPRVVDEAAAAYVAGAIERQTCAWYSPAAGAARVRRRALAHVLDRIERALPELPAVSERPAERPPWALWYDPGAQAAYVAAEAIAGAIERAIGAEPAPGALSAALAAWREPIDRLGATVHAI